MVDLMLKRGTSTADVQRVADERGWRLLGTTTLDYWDPYGVVWQCGEERVTLRHLVPLGVALLELPDDEAAAVAGLVDPLDEVRHRALDQGGAPDVRRHALRAWTALHGGRDETLRAELARQVAGSDLDQAMVWTLTMYQGHARAELQPAIVARVESAAEDDPWLAAWQTAVLPSE